MLPRVGVVGSPDQIGVLVPLLQSFKFQVLALWCKDHDKCCKLAAKFGVPYQAEDFKDVLLHSEVDLVYVATAPGKQAEVAVKALTSGKHCICQMPPTICQSEAEKMVRLSQYYSKLHSLLESHVRFLPAVQKLKSLLREGYCGQLLLMEVHVVMGSLIHEEPYSWKCEASMGGGVLNMLGADVIDLISFLSEQHACECHASLSTFRPTTRTINGYRVITSDDYCCFQLKHRRGFLATVTLNSHAPGHFNFNFSVTGTRGRLVVQGLDLYGCKDGGKQDVLLKQTETDLQKYGMKGNHKYPSTLLQHLVIGYQEMFAAVVKILQGSEQSSNLPTATFEDGVYIRTVLDALHASNKERKWVDVPTVGRVEPTNPNPFWTSSTQPARPSRVSSSMSVKESAHFSQRDLSSLGKSKLSTDSLISQRHPLSSRTTDTELKKSTAKTHEPVYV